MFAGREKSNAVCKRGLKNWGASVQNTVLAQLRRGSLQFWGVGSPQKETVKKPLCYNVVTLSVRQRNLPGHLSRFFGDVP